MQPLKRGGDHLRRELRNRHRLDGDVRSRTQHQHEVEPTGEVT